mmetsp:Transcript_64873/g.115416  ORF Transcript_64873/g.115416 Transcript_64873/m.115416 type:complete len:238 (+) Transcript_64873:1685-2398(+)
MLWWGWCGAGDTCRGGVLVPDSFRSGWSGWGDKCRGGVLLSDSFRSTAGSGLGDKCRGGVLVPDTFRSGWSGCGDKCRGGVLQPDSHRGGRRAASVMKTLSKPEMWSGALAGVSVECGGATIGLSGPRPEREREPDDRRLLTDVERGGSAPLVWEDRLVRLRLMGTWDFRIDKDMASATLCSCGRVMICERTAQVSNFLLGPGSGLSVRSSGGGARPVDRQGCVLFGTGDVLFGADF